MNYKVTILKDSKIPYGNRFIRVTTMEVTLPRIVLAEFNTHRVFSRNTSSSRAIPTKRMIRDFVTFCPDEFPINGKGMQPKGFLKGWRKLLSKFIWNFSRYVMITMSWLLYLIGVHKEITNRLLESFMWTTIIVTSTDWENFFELRCHPDAQRQIRLAALKMKEALENSIPVCTDLHLPFISDRDLFDQVIHSFHQGKDGFQLGALELIKECVALVARGSYLNQHIQVDLVKNLELYNQLITSRPIHASPAEAVVMSFEFYLWLLKDSEVAEELKYIDISECHGNLKYGVVQFRKVIE